MSAIELESVNDGPSQVDEEQTAVKTIEANGQTGVQSRQTAVTFVARQESGTNNGSFENDRLLQEEKKPYDFALRKPYSIPDKTDEWNCCKGLSKMCPFEPNSCSIQFCLKITFIILFAAVILGCVIVSKLTLLFVATQLNPYVKVKRSAIKESVEPDSCAVPVCIIADDPQCSEKESVRWVWCMFFIQCIPYLLMSVMCLLKMCFKRERKPKFNQLLIVLVMETFHILGMFILLYTLLPFLGVFIAVMLFSNVALIPSILQIVFGSRVTKCASILPMIMQAVIPWLLLWLPALNSGSEHSSWENICSSLNSSFRNLNEYASTDTVLTTTTVRPELTYNFAAAGVLPVENSHIWKAIGVILVSVIYWENFINSKPGFLKSLHDEIVKKNAVTYFIVGIYRSLLTFLLLLMYYGINHEITLDMLFDTNNLYGNKCNVLPDTTDNYLHADWLQVAALQISANILGFFISGLAIKGNVQIQSFTIPLVMMATPVCYVIMFWPCAECNTSFDIGTIFYWNCNAGKHDAYEALLSSMSLVGILGFASFAWITHHLWSPSHRKLTQTEKIFSWPFPCGALLEQSLMLLRRSNDQELNRRIARVAPHNVVLEDVGQPVHTITDVTTEELTKPYVPTLRYKENDHGYTFIYFCATMWHETETEMLQILRSIFKMNNDQVVRDMLKGDNEKESLDFYEFEVHIFFDDALTTDKVTGEKVINEYVDHFIKLYNKALCSVLQIRIKDTKPKRCDTDYGGKLIWTMPFKNNKIVVHLKDKEKIRKGKRWSQIMYMHYILGQCIMSQRISNKKFADVADNTYILALDGDVDFEPQSVILLLDLMKANHKVGAACGRIHPIGSGPMVWYQKFEYSISHWLQKTTEHVLGCVLCSPGCFSLFRASALMEVVDTYQTIACEADECVQYDQGEDRWLCTLLLKHGFRVEYCAAGDAYTYAPETFNEFFKQRRRWITSTFANIMDVLSSGIAISKKNDSISYLYIFYQALLFASSILGPGTLFLMIVGTIDMMINIQEQKLSFGWILLITVIPFVAFMILCFFGKKDTQLNVAAILSTIFAVLQVFVFVGLLSGVVEGGLCSPSSLLLMSVLGAFLLAAILHPTEFTNIVHLFMFYLFVPSTYLLLIIYAICNVNDVSWGTRETPKVEYSESALEQKLPQQNDQQSKTPQSWTQKMMSLFSLSSANTSSDHSGCSLSCKPLFRCGCCISPGESEKDKKLNNVLLQITALGDEITELKEITQNDQKRKEQVKKEKKEKKEEKRKRKNGAIDDIEDQESSEHREQPDVNTGINQINTRDGENETQDKQTKNLKFNQFPKGKRNENEMKFWTDLVKYYLYPVELSDDDKNRLQNGLKELRIKSVFAFFIINIILIAMVWGTKLVNLHVPIQCAGKEPTQIDPVGIAFICVFGVILALQVLGMLIHRLYTVVQLISTTILCIPTSKGEDGSRKAIKHENVLKDLIKILIKNLDQPDEIPQDQNDATNIRNRKTKEHTLADLTLLLQSRITHELEKKDKSDSGNHLDRNLVKRMSMHGMLNNHTEEQQIAGPSPVQPQNDIAQPSHEMRDAAPAIDKEQETEEYHADGECVSIRN